MWKLAKVKAISYWMLRKEFAIGCEETIPYCLDIVQMSQSEVECLLALDLAYTKQLLELMTLDLKI